MRDNETIEEYISRQLGEMHETQKKIHTRLYWILFVLAVIALLV